MTGFEGLVMFMRWCRVDVKRYFPLERPLKWFQWGYILDRNKETAWYILIGLPSYLMKSTDYDMGLPVMHQSYLLFKEELPAGKGGWLVLEIECDR